MNAFYFIINILVFFWFSEIIWFGLLGRVNCIKYYLRTAPWFLNYSEQTLLRNHKIRSKLTVKSVVSLVNNKFYVRDNGNLISSKRTNVAIANSCEINLILAPIPRQCRNWQDRNVEIRILLDTFDCIPLPFMILQYLEYSRK